MATSTTATRITVPPQRVPVGSFRTPQGLDVQVTISQPWFLALQALIRSSGSDGNDGTGSVNFDALPPYDFGNIVFTSGPTNLQRLPAGDAGQALFSAGPGAAPVWAAIPDPPVTVTPRQIAAYGALRAY
jgi:hypothetical protein